MYSRVTLVEIDTLRVDVEDAVRMFREEVLSDLQEQEGYEGVFVLTTPEGKGMIVSIWDSEEAAAMATDFANAALERFMTLFRAPPGREQYELALAEFPAVSVG